MTDIIVLMQGGFLSLLFTLVYGIWQEVKEEISNN